MAGVTPVFFALPFLALLALDKIQTSAAQTGHRSRRYMSCSAGLVVGVGEQPARGARSSRECLVRCLEAGLGCWGLDVCPGEGGAVVCTVTGGSGGSEGCSGLVPGPSPLCRHFYKETTPSDVPTGITTSTAEMMTTAPAEVMTTSLAVVMTTSLAEVMTTSPAEQWLEKPCASDADCPAVKASCFEGVCLCTPGYVYSLSQNICKDGCAAGQWQPVYMAYPGGGMTDNNIGGEWLDYQGCCDWCNTYPGCIHFEYQSSSPWCYFGNATALQSPDDWDVGWTGWVFHQRTCL